MQYGRVALAVLRIALVAAVFFGVSSAISCAVMGGYDFDGYKLKGRDTLPDGGCIPYSCQDLNADCGRVPDGCGGSVECGTCAAGTCGGGGPNKCGIDPCTARSCADLGASCGEISDG